MKQLILACALTLMGVGPVLADSEADQLQEAREALRAAQEQAREAAREVAKLSRERALQERERVREARRAEARDRAFAYSFSYGNRAIIGVLMGEAEPNAGVTLMAVTPGSAADEAGLISGDVLVEVNGERVDDQKYPSVALAEAHELIGDLEVGSVVELKYRRDGGREQTVQLTAKERARSDFAFGFAPEVNWSVEPEEWEAFVAEWNDHGTDWAEYGEQWAEFAEQYAELAGRMAVEIAPMPPVPSAGPLSPLPPVAPTAPVAPVLAMPDFLALGRAWHGLELTELNPDLARYFGVDDGALVISAELEGVDLRGGDVIVEVEGQAVRSPRDVMRGLRVLTPGEAFSLQIVRDRDRLTLDAEVPSSDYAVVPRPD